MQFEASRLEGLEHRTDAQSAPEVFFTPIITPESLVAAYHALGRKPEGKTAIKVHSGESEKSNNLNPSLVKDLRAGDRRHARGMRYRIRRQS